MALPGGLLVGAVADQARVSALGGGIGQQQCRRSCHARDTQLIQCTFEVGERLRRARRIGAHHRRGGQRRQLAAQLGDHAAIEVQLQCALLCGQRHMRPLPFRNRLRRRAALAIELHERHPVFDAQHQFGRTVATRVDRLCSVVAAWLDPGRNSERRARLLRKRCAGRQRQRGCTQLNAAADHRAFRWRHHGAGIVAISGGVACRRIGLGEVVDQRIVRIEHLLAVAAGGGLFIAVVHPDRLRCRSADRRHVHPDQRQAQLGIELFDLVGQHGAAITRDKAQVVARILGAVEAEVAGMQAQQQRRATRVTGQARALRAGVDGDRLAVLPFGLPPIGIGRSGRQRNQRGQQQQHSGKQTVHAKGLQRTHVHGKGQ